MAVFSGFAGTVSFDSASTLNVTSFTLDISVDTQESTAMGDTYRSRVAGFKDWTATVEARADSAGLDPALGDLGLVAKTLVLDTVGGKVYTITAGAMVTDMSINQDMEDTVSVTYTFVGSSGVAVVESA